ncbi:MAG: hypothetical protein KIG62_06615 [Oscillospiraceae bacterium]|nr:hypothetical protein [Oscillospiraceae bacterium]
MEYIVGTVMIVLLLFFLGMEWTQIVLLFFFAVGVAFGLLFLFFVFCAVVALASKPVSAEFSEIKRNNRGFVSPHYIAEGREYPNLFPCEVVLRDKLYIKGRTVRVRVNKALGVVLDKNAVYSIVFGLLASLVLAAVILGMLMPILEWIA